MVSALLSADHSQLVASCGTIASFSSISISLSHSAANTMRPTKVRASVGSSTSGSSARPMRSFCECAASDVRRAGDAEQRAQREDPAVGSCHALQQVASDAGSRRARGTKRLDARLDARAVELAGRVVPAREAGHERLKALQAHRVRRRSSAIGSAWSSTRMSSSDRLHRRGCAARPPVCRACRRRRLRRRPSPRSGARPAAAAPARKAAAVACSTGRRRACCRRR